MLHNLPFENILSQEGNLPKPALTLSLTTAMMQSGGTLWFPTQRWCHMTWPTADFEDPWQKQRNRNWPWCPQSMTSSNESNKIRCWWLHGQIKMMYQVQMIDSVFQRPAWSAVSIQAKTRARLSIGCVNLIWCIQNQYQHEQIRCHLVPLIGHPLVWLFFINELSVFSLGDMSK